MRAAVKQFIEETIDWIENDNWSDVAYKAESWNIDGRLRSVDLIEFWKIIREDLNIDILKLEDFDVVPSYYFCSSDIAEVTIQIGCLHINQSAFLNCKKLKKVTLPNTLFSIQQNAFLGTPELTEIEFDGTLDEFKQIRLGLNAFGSEILGRNDKKLIAKDGVMQL